MSLALLGAFAGGVGLFLLGMQLMTKGLMEAAGPSLRRILQAATASPARGLFSGFTATAVVQSSSAVTVATIGFVNAELMQLSQAIPVIFGSNVGTTITGWLVATLGFKLKVEVFALPMIGLGMAFRVIYGGSAPGRVGEALAGFGLFFVGVDVLREAFEGLAATTDLSRYSGRGIVSVLTFVLVGVVLTTLLQSSSAAMALVLTAASGGLVTVEDAAALVIGANVGTTTTAVLSVIGASPAARRLAGAHVLFNLITAAVGLLILPLLLVCIRLLQEALGVEQDLSLLLALFHTFFNVLGVLLLWRFVGRLTAFLERRFGGAAADSLQPRHLEAALIQWPMLAMAAAGRELVRADGSLRSLASTVLNSRSAHTPVLQARQRSIGHLLQRIGEYLSLIQRTALQPAPVESLGHLMKALAAQHAFLDRIEKLEPVTDAIATRGLANVLAAWEGARRATLQLLVHGGADDRAAYSPEELAAADEALQHQLKNLRKQVLHAAADGGLQVAALVEKLERLDRVRQLADQSVRCARARFLVDEVVRSISGESPVTPQEAAAAPAAPPA